MHKGAIMDHNQRQLTHHDELFAKEPRSHIVSIDPVTRFIVNTRVEESMTRFMHIVGPRLTKASAKVLVACAGEGLEGSILCNMGYLDVTISDLSPNGVKAALERDPRLHGLVLNAEHTGLPDNSFDVVLIQDGLHHLQQPVLGLTEMLRLAKVGVIFLEGHDTLICRLSGTEWEINGSAVNYVFRWTRRGLKQIVSSYLGPDSFEDYSYTFWHHNMVFARFPGWFGNKLALPAIRTVKWLLDRLLGRFGNSFCGLIVKK